jgi:hypothetical protein
MYVSSKRKNWKVYQVLHDGAWVRKIDLERDFTLEQLSQFVELWSLAARVNINEDVDDDIVWKLTANGQ